MSEGDPRLYSVNRDVAHNFKDIMRIVADRLRNRCWPGLEAVMATEHVTDQNVSQAFDCLCRFILSAQEHPRMPFEEALAKSGFEQCQNAAQVAVLAMLGSVTLGYHFVGVREATIGGVGPAKELADLAQEATAVVRWFSMPRWRRSLVALWRWVRRKT